MYSGSVTFFFLFSFFFFCNISKRKTSSKEKKNEINYKNETTHTSAGSHKHLYFPSNDRDRGAIQQGSSREHLRQPRPVAVEVAVCYVARIFNEFSSALVALGPLTPFSSCEIARVRMLPPTPTD